MQHKMRDLHSQIHKYKASSLRGDVKNIVIVLGGAQHNMSARPQLLVKKLLTFMLTFDPEASKTCKNMKKLFNFVFCPYLRVV